MKEIFYTIYETICKINGKRYRGFHSTHNPNDLYMGSGTALKKAVEKYGIENFEKVILEICSSHEEMLLAEKKWVNEEWIARKDTYNMCLGGKGGWDYINTEGLRWNEEKRKEWSDHMKEINSGKGWPDKIYEKPGFLGKHHTEDAKRKMSEKSKRKLSLEEIEKRKRDVEEVDKNWGYVTFLSKKWNISHTQVRRFINLYIHRGVA